MPIKKEGKIVSVLNEALCSENIRGIRSIEHFLDPETSCRQVVSFTNIPLKLLFYLCFQLSVRLKLQSYPWA
jgi:hypothetical protein